MNVQTLPVTKTSCSGAGSLPEANCVALPDHPRVHFFRGPFRTGISSSCWSTSGQKGMKMQSKVDQEHQIAVFIDLDNIAIGVKEANIKKLDINKILDRLVEKGKITVRDGMGSEYTMTVEYGDFGKISKR